MARRLRRTRLVALAAVVGLGLTACGGSDINDSNSSASGGGKDCGDLRIAVNPWT
jgi:glycine betaine/proline transport system substrate-binding protein